MLRAWRRLAAVSLFGSALLAMPGVAKPQPATCPDNALALGSGVTLVCRCDAAAVGAAGAVWGSGPYTADSAICRAARHAGVVAATGGMVRLRMAPGANAYQGSSRNGITTSPYGSYGASYRFDGAQQEVSVSASGVPECPQDARALEGRAEPLTCRCSDDAAGAGSVWGSDTYTSDSGICRAAVHAGAIGSAGGTVTLRMLPGRQSYAGVTRNGVASAPYGSYGASYSFEGATGGIGQCPDSMSGAAGGEPRLVCLCPAEATQSGAIWGSGPYTSDSAVCRAALHAGRVTAAGGKVEVVSAPGQQQYQGSERNGVRTSDYGAYPSSFTFR